MLASRESNLIVVSKQIYVKKKKCSQKYQIKAHLMFCYVFIRQYHLPALPCLLKTSFGELKKLFVSHFLFSTKSV